MKIDAIILAGGGVDKSLKKYCKSRGKAFIKIDNKIMVEYSIDAVRQVEQIDRVVLVADPEHVPADIKNKVDLIVNGGDSIATSLKLGVKALEPKPKRVLVLPCDLPMINSNVIEDFITRSVGVRVDITYAYLSKKNSEKKYPDLRHTYVKLKDGTFCGTGLFLMNPEIIDSCEAFFNKLSDNRKNPFGLASLLGFGFLIKLILGKLTIKEIEGQIYTIMKCSGKGIETKYAEAGFNVDNPEDLELTRKLFEDGVKI
ncbi:MAG: nucleotidyltransferase family protein [Candidatus Eremiobacteraeota bacterium]|nr:nucleotidyltransferase family protein [Candidatus Eremiobacteraeota bacterium]